MHIFLLSYLYKTSCHYHPPPPLMPLCVLQWHVLLTELVLHLPGVCTSGRAVHSLHELLLFEFSTACVYVFVLCVLEEGGSGDVCASCAWLHCCVNTYAHTHMHAFFCVACICLHTCNLIPQPFSHLALFICSHILYYYFGDIQFGTFLPVICLCLVHETHCAILKRPSPSFAYAAAI